MEVLTKLRELKQVWSDAREDGKITPDEMATIAIELGEVLTEAGKTLQVILGLTSEDTPAA